MKMLGKIVGAACLAAAMTYPVDASAQQRVRVAALSRIQQQHATCIGNADELQRRMIAMMKDARYLGFRCDRDTNIYTFKFLRNGTVIWVDVDGRSGRIIRRTGE